MKEFIYICGWVASALSILRMSPQLIKIIRTKSTNDVSWLTQILSILFGVLILTYGVLKGDLAISFTNASVAAIGIGILVTKMIMKDEKNPKVCLEKEYVKLKLAEKNKTNKEL